MEAVMTYDGIYASLFTYDRSTHIVQAFCEAGSLMTNTLLTSVGTDIDPTSTPQCCKYLFQAYTYLYNRCRQPGGGRSQKDEGRSIHINE
nr:1,2-dihydroxy-3-keto-5-methylthiopentene dioxygenase 4 [Ipomoea batatas]